MTDRSQDHPPTLNYAPPAPSSRRPLHRAAVMALVGLGIILGLAIVGSVIPHRAGPQALTIKCASNLRQVGTAIMMYAVEHQGQFPDRWDTLLEALGSDLDAKFFVCPASDATPLVNANHEGKVPQLANLERCSYFFLGPHSMARTGELMNTLPIDRVLAYELPGHHPDGAINVLFSDSHVETVGGANARHLLGLIATDVRPVIWPPPSTQPTSRELTPASPSSP